MTTFLARSAAVLGFVLLLTAGYSSDLGRATSAATVGLAAVVALVHYGHQAVTLAWAERIRNQTRSNR